MQWRGIVSKRLKAKVSCVAAEILCPAARSITCYEIRFTNGEIGHQGGEWGGVCVGETGLFVPWEKRISLMRGTCGEIPNAEI